jgi:cell volume regulation protein A
LVPEHYLDKSISEYMLVRLGGSAEIGDRVMCGEVDLIVRDVRSDSDIVEVGLAIDRREQQTPFPLLLFVSALWQQLRKWLKLVS